jgi:hypothetical protein
MAGFLLYHPHYANARESESPGPGMTPLGIRAEHRRVATPAACGKDLLGGEPPPATRWPRRHGPARAVSAVAPSTDSDHTAGLELASGRVLEPAELPRESDRWRVPENKPHA